MANMMCNACGKVGEPYHQPSCEKPECPANGVVRMLGALTDPREAAFNELRKAATEAGTVPSALDWFKAGIHHAQRNAGVQNTRGGEHG